MSCHGCPVVAVQSIQSGLLYHVDMRSCLYHLVIVKARRQTSQPITTVAETSFGLHNDWFAQSAPTTLISRQPYSLIPPYTSTHKQPNTPLNFTSAPPDHIRPHPQPHSQTPPLDTIFRRDLEPFSNPKHVHLHSHRLRLRPHRRTHLPLRHLHNRTTKSPLPDFQLAPRVLEALGLRGVRRFWAGA